MRGRDGDGGLAWPYQPHPDGRDNGDDALHGDLEALRAVLRATQHIARYEPRGDEAAWRAAEDRMGG